MQTINHKNTIYTIERVIESSYRRTIIKSDNKKQWAMITPSEILLLRIEVATIEELDNFVEILKKEYDFLHEMIINKFEQDFNNACNVAEGLKIAFDNLPNNYLK